MPLWWLHTSKPFFVFDLDDTLIATRDYSQRDHYPVDDFISMPSAKQMVFVRPGARELLQFLKAAGYPLGLFSCSNCTHIEHLLAAADIPEDWFVMICDESKCTELSVRNASGIYETELLKDLSKMHPLVPASQCVLIDNCQLHKVAVTRCGSTQEQNLCLVPDYVPRTHSDIAAGVPQDTLFPRLQRAVVTARAPQTGLQLMSPPQGSDIELLLQALRAAIHEAQSAPPVPELPVSLEDDASPAAAGAEDPISPHDLDDFSVRFPELPRVNSASQSPRGPFVRCSLDLGDHLERIRDHACEARRAPKRVAFAEFAEYFGDLPTKVSRSPLKAPRPCIKSGARSDSPARCTSLAPPVDGAPAKGAERRAASAEKMPSPPPAKRPEAGALGADPEPHGVASPTPAAGGPGAQPPAELSAVTLRDVLSGAPGAAVIRDDEPLRGAFAALAQSPAQSLLLVDGSGACRDVLHVVDLLRVIVEECEAQIGTTVSKPWFELARILQPKCDAFDVSAAEYLRRRGHAPYNKGAVLDFVAGPAPDTPLVSVIRRGLLDEEAPPPHQLPVLVTDSPHILCSIDIICYLAKHPALIGSVGRCTLQVVPHGTWLQRAGLMAFRGQLTEDMRGTTDVWRGVADGRRVALYAAGRSCRPSSSEKSPAPVCLYGGGGLQMESRSVPLLQMQFVRQTATEPSTGC